MKRYRLRLLSIILLASICLVFDSCKKFEEDEEWIHFRTVKKRIEGKKELISHTLGSETDLIPYWNSRFGEFYLDFTLIQKNSNQKGDGYILNVYDKVNDVLLCSGRWGKIYDDQFYLEFECLFSDTTQSFPQSVSSIGGSIVKLSNSDLRIKKFTTHPVTKKSVMMEAQFIQY